MRSSPNLLYMGFYFQIFWRFSFFFGFRAVPSKRGMSETWDNIPPDIFPLIVE